MRFSSANIESLRSLYLGQVRTLLSAELQLVEGLPDLLAHASDPQLRQAIQSHLHDTEEQIARLEEVLQGSPVEAAPAHSEVMTALLAEARRMLATLSDNAVRDAALIAAAQRIEHYEMAAYGAVRHFARILGETRQAQLLDRTLREEGRADQVLTDIAERVNVYARTAA